MSAIEVLQELRYRPVYNRFVNVLQPPYTFRYTVDVLDVQTRMHFRAPARSANRWIERTGLFIEGG